MTLPEDPFPIEPLVVPEAVPTIDPAIFEEEGMPAFLYALSSYAGIFGKAQETLEKFNPDGTSKTNRPGGTIGQLLDRHIEETGSGVRLDLPAGGMTIQAVGGQPDSPEEPKVFRLEEILAEEYEEAVTSAEASSLHLVGLVQGYRDHVREQIDGIVEDFRLEDKSWELAWKKVHEIIRAMGGTSLAYVVDFFDGLIEIKYPETFDHMTFTRGEEAKKDVAASTFLTVMKPHIRRANMRKGKDAWS